MPNKSLRRRLISILTGVFVVLAALVVTGVTLFAYRSEEDAWRGRQREASRSAAESISSVVRQANDGLLLAGKFLHRMDSEDYAPILKDILQNNPALLEVLYLDQAGRPLGNAATDRPVLSNLFTIAQSQWFREAAAGKSFTSKVQISSRDTPYLILAAPAEGGRVTAARLDMEVLWTAVTNISFGRTGKAYVADDTGQIITHTDRQFYFSNTSIAGLEAFTSIQAAAGNDWHGSGLNLQNERVVMVSTRIPNTSWMVITELPVGEAFANTHLAFALLLGAMTLLTLGAVRAAYIGIDDLIVRPVMDLRRAAERISLGDLEVRTTPLRQDEIGQVALAFNEMATHLQRQRQQLQQWNNELEQRVNQRTEQLAREVEERKQAEEQVRASLHEKEVLLKEIHHRVKNNLQVISSLLNLQASRTGDPQALSMLRDSQNRVRSMALIHEKLYQSDSLAQIDFAGYLQSLVRSLFQSYRNEGQVELVMLLGETMLDIDRAVPCGLIVNELVSNALKYAFPNGRRGSLWVELGQAGDGKHFLRVADDGPGLPEGFEIRQGRSLGLQLVRSLTGQVDGVLEIRNNPGAEFVVTF